MKLLKIIKLIFLLLFLVIELDSIASQSEGETCPCGKYSINKLVVKEKIDKIELKMEDIKNEEKDDKKLLGKGGFGKVFHAYWPKENKCVALKISELLSEKKESNTAGINREVDVLKYFNEIDLNKQKRNYIIKMFGYEEKGNYMYIVLELGEGLLHYFNEAIKTKNIMPRTNEDLIIKIIKGAALALEQFHKFGVHGDVKPENFVVFNENVKFIESKLIDFNISVINGQEPIKGTKNISEYLKAPEIYGTDELTKEADIWAFGRMVYRLFYQRDNFEYSIHYYLSNTEYNTKLDRVIKACLKGKPGDRPTLLEIYRFLIDKMKYFPFEKREIELKEKIENERLKKEKEEKRNLNWLPIFTV